MPLSPTMLANSLEQHWLARDRGSLPGSAVESGDRFARAVADWLGVAMAAGMPCATAQARKPQLAAAAAAALQLGNAQAAGMQLGLAVASYLAGQSFGPGTAGFPVAASVLQSELAAVFADVDMPAGMRAQRMAAACYAAAVSTMVIFPPPMPPAPIM